jgi:hypothetical protein
MRRPLTARNSGEQGKTLLAKKDTSISHEPPSYDDQIAAKRTRCSLASFMASGNDRSP